MVDSSKVDNQRDGAARARVHGGDKGSEDQHPGSASEKCGFVFHVLISLVGFLYIGWVMLLAFDPYQGDSLSPWQSIVSSTPSPALEGNESRIISILFLLRQVILSVGALLFPDIAWIAYISTTAILCFVSAPVLYGALNNLVATTSSHSTDSLWDMYTRRVPQETKDSNPRPKPASDQNVPSTSTVPAICDLDVAMINDLVFSNLNERTPNSGKTSSTRLLAREG